MKRFLSLSLALLLCFGLLAGCTNSNSADQPDGANGGIIEDSSANMTDPADENLLDRSKNAVDDMVDDMDPNRDTTNTATGKNPRGTATHGTDATTDNNTAR